MTATVKMAGAGVLVVLGLWGAACAVTGPDDSETAAILRSYAVDPERRDTLRDMLQSALAGTGGDRIGQVSEGPGGTLLVVAPARIHSGLRGILAADPGPPPAPRPVTLTYWLVVGRPPPAPAAADVPATGARDDPRLEPVLARITAAQGPTDFVVLESLRLTSMPQSYAETLGRHVEVGHTAVRAGDAIVADVSIRFVPSPELTNGTGNELASRVRLEPAQFLVLGEAGFRGDAARVWPDGADGATLYYVMTADLAP